MFLLITLLQATLISASQSLKQISFSNASNLSSLTFAGDQGIMIKVSEYGQVQEWGTELESYRYNYYPGRLQQFMGRVDFYGPEADSINRGKLKSIGTTYLTYFSDYETTEKKGKLRSIGSCFIDYFSNYETPLLRGKIKYAGTVELNYYTSFDNEAFRGKLKQAGNTLITYYSNFEQPFRAGKIRTIGQLVYTWTDSRGFQGAWQSIPMAPVINGITYIVLGF